MLSKIGTGELIVILIVALFVIGPDKLPGLARAFGKAVGEARKYLKDITDEIEEETVALKEELTGIENDIKDINKDIENDINDIGKSVDKKSDEGNAGTSAITDKELSAAGEEEVSDINIESPSEASA